MIQVNNGHFVIIENSTLSTIPIPKIIILPGSLSQNSGISTSIQIESNNDSNNSRNGSHYEIMLPVIFIILFLMILFFIYALTNLEFKKRFKQTCCCFLPSSMTHFKNNSNTLIYQQNRLQSGLMPRFNYQSNILRKSIIPNQANNNEVNLQ